MKLVINIFPKGAQMIENKKTVCPECGGSNLGSNGKIKNICRDCGKQWRKMHHSQLKEQAFQAQILELLEKKTIPIHRYHGDIVRFGVVSDTHFGSLYEHEDVLHLAYKIFKEEGIDNVYHPGDMCDGEKMYRGQEYEIYAHGADNQVGACCDRYPKFKGIQTYFILGSHDLSFYKQSGVNIGPKITEKRPDLIYIGQEEADVVIRTKRGEIVLRMVHPGSGTAYALSYAPQKYIESLAGGQKPNVLLIGHYHNAEYLPCYRNIFACQVGSIQGQTPYMKRMKLAAHVGFWIFELRVGQDNSVMRFKAEFFAHYESRTIQREIKI